MNQSSPSYRYPAEIISHAVWLCRRFSLSFRNIEEILFSRPVNVTYESVRQWCQGFGSAYAKRIRAGHWRSGDTWHLDGVFIRINGKQCYRWRAVDQNGEVLDILDQTRRNARAARRCFRKLLKSSGIAPRVVVTDKLGSYGAAHRDLGMGAQHETGRYRNNRARNSHPPTRRRERHMKGFKPIVHAQRLLAAHAQITDLFRHDRLLMSAQSYRVLRQQSHRAWRDFAGIAPAA